MNERVLIGVVAVALCGLGLWHHRWLLEATPKGQRLVGWFGEERALWVIRGLLATGIAFGTLLATGVIRPIEW
ncbi:MAG: hypothetical protein M3552_15905 [Planctomycetota bacterium]|nr:hypothetical protein [Planctomycetaceae bacterium]MDQ3332110.1 hypothetical protein [Planctomycetota bacterium]